MYNLHYDDWMKLSLDSEVIETKEIAGQYWHRFQDTVFFVEGGGMESDTGTVNGNSVLAVKVDEEDQIWHLLDQQITGQVHLEIDEWQRRRKVQIHTSGHLISAVAGQLYQVTTASFSESEEESIEELTFPSCDQDILKNLEIACNCYIREDLRVEIRYPSHEEAKAHMGEGEEVHDHLRAVLIENIDYDFCGCIHVPSLGQIQAIHFLGYEKTTRGYKLRYVCGEQLLKMYGVHYAQLSESAKALGVPQLALLDGVEKIQIELKACKSELSVWKQRMIELTAQNLHTLVDSPCVFQEIDDMDIKMFQSFCSYFVRTYEKGIFFICKLEDRCHVMISHGKNMAFSCNTMFKDLSTTFALRGGGNPMMAQGGGIYQDSLVNALKALCDQQNKASASDCEH